MTKAIIEYLQQTSSKLELSKIEKERIETSVESIRKKLIPTFFDDGLKEVIVFGSFERETLLSRSVDTESDVDILIVFEEKKLEPQTYLNKLKKFAEDNYSRSEIYQDHPTVVIELNHIKFELTPCVFKAKTFWNDSKYIIPQKKNNNITWVETKPYFLRDKIGKYGKTKYTLIGLILIFKYWNILNHSLYATFTLEEFIINNFDDEKGISENFFKIVKDLYFSNLTNEQKELNKKIKKQRSNIILLVENEMEEYAMLELKKIVKELKINI